MSVGIQGAPAPLAVSGGVKARSRAMTVLRRIVRSTTGLTGLIIVAFVVGASLLAPVLAPYDARTDRNLENVRRPPGLEHPFGTDELGRDTLTRVLHGGRISLRVGLLAVGMAVLVDRKSVV